MAKLVLGMGMSQSPLLSIPPEHWQDHAENDKTKTDLCRPDGRLVSYTEQLDFVQDRFRDVISLAQFKTYHAASQTALARLADDLETAKPDLLLVIGDDHAELFEAGNMPAISIYHGTELANQLAPLPPDTPQWKHDRRNAAALPPELHYPGAPEFAGRLIEGLIEAEIDITAIGHIPSGKGIGHAWAFVVNRILCGRKLPIVPIILNSGYPPNIPTQLRCYKIGQAIARAVRAMPQDLRVGVTVAGGLSHYLVNEALDRQVMTALEKDDAAALTTLAPEALLMGSGEIRDWILMAGVMSGLKLQWSDYLPAYRTPAGTGTGLAFASWS